MPILIQQIIQYLLIPFRRPRLLLAFIILPTLVALLYGIMVPAPYKTTAVVAMVKTRTDISFDDRIVTTQANDQLVSGKTTSALQDRATEYSLLAKNGAIAADVVKQLGDQLPADLRDPAKLLRRVNASVITPGNMIGITAVDDDPTLAALIANTWASSYELYVNKLYSGGATGYSQSVQSELARAKTNYDVAQQAVEDFLPTSKISGLQRDISAKQTLLDLLTRNQTTAISSTIEQQIQVQTQIINTYVSAQVANQLLAFNRQQDARRAMLGQFIDDEIQSRMIVLRRDRDLREQAFKAASEADMDNRMAVVQQEVSAKREALAQAYAEQTRLSKLLNNAQTMRVQVNEGGDSAAASNTLALLLLKTQIFAGQGTDDNQKLSNLPGNLQIQSDGTVPTTAAGQLRDIDAVVVAIQGRIDDLGTEITTRSNEILAGTGYNFLSEFSANSSTLPVTATAILSSTSAVSIPLTTAIAQRYNELFDVGGLAQTAVRTDDTTPLFAEIKKLYPDLFSFDALTQLTQDISTDNPLYKAAIQRTQDLIELKNVQGLTGSSSNDAMSSSMTQMENDINKLRGELETQSTLFNNLSQARDISRETFITLTKKQEEVNIASVITGSEIRLAIPAMPATQKTQSTLTFMILAAMLGFIFGAVAIMALHLLMRDEPLGSIGGKPNASWNRAFRWLTAPVHFSMRWARGSDDTISPRGEHSVTS